MHARAVALIEPEGKPMSYDGGDGDGDGSGGTPSPKPAPTPTPTPAPRELGDE
jgi:hypothetical protein